MPRIEITSHISDMDKTSSSHGSTHAKNVACSLASSSGAAHNCDQRRAPDLILGISYTNHIKMGGAVKKKTMPHEDLSTVPVPAKGQPFLPPSLPPSLPPPIQPPRRFRWQR